MFEKSWNFIKNLLSTIFAYLFIIIIGFIGLLFVIILLIFILFILIMLIPLLVLLSPGLILYYILCR